jgi:hypothetical protein
LNIWLLLGVVEVVFNEVVVGVLVVLELELGFRLPQGRHTRSQ